MTTTLPVGRLHLVPTPLDHGCDSPMPLIDVLPMSTLHAAASITHWIGENAKSTRAFLARVNAVTPLCVPIQAQSIVELPHAVHKKGDHDLHTPRPDMRPLLTAALQGHDIGLISEAGMPAIADPGSSVVRTAHELGISVVPLVGPVSITLALAASGLNGQNFAFVGYLPQNASARAQRIRELEARAHRSGEAQVFIETPYRNPALLQALLTTLHGDTRLVLASGLTLPDQMVRSAPVTQWKHASDLLDRWRGNRTPTVFALGR